MKYYTISVNGQKAVDAGREFCKGSCYRQIITHGKALAQLEVVVDDSGEYNGNPNKWVDVSYIKTGADVEQVLTALAKIGFSGCPCIVTEDTETGCYARQEELFACII